MRTLFRTGFMVSAMVLAAQGALAQAVTTFDGTYGGVSLTTNGGSASIAHR